MNKPLAIIKAAAAGVTALYHAVESAKHSVEGEGFESRQAAGEWRIAVGNMQLALDELHTEPKPKPNPYRFNGAGSVMPVFHGSDDS